MFVFSREACYYVSDTEGDGYDAAVECSMSASGARLAVAMNKVELESFKETTPNYDLWLGKYCQQVILSLH